MASPTANDALALREAFIHERIRKETIRADRFAQLGREPGDRLAWLVGAVLRASGLYHRGFANACSPVLTRLNMPLRRLPAVLDGFTIFHICDFHFFDNTRFIESIRAICDGVACDVCVITGDFPFDDATPMDIAMDATQRVLRGISSGHGFFSCLGNNDRLAHAERLRAMGVTVLMNDHVEIAHAGATIALIGADDPHRYCHGSVACAVDGVPDEAVKILLAHSPEAYEEAALCDIDLYICGHTHGGQICLPGGFPLFSNVRAPRRLRAGCWTYKNMLGFTSRGLGATAVPVRFNCPPEAALITLRRSPEP